MIVNNKELEGTFENSKSSIGTKFDSEELNFFKVKYFYSNYLKYINLKY